jgi:hypothetical protein
VPERTSLPLTWIPLSESRSMTDQVPSGALAQLRVLARDARVGGRAGQVDVRLARGLAAAAADADLGAREREPAARRRTRGKVIVAATAASAARTWS